MITTQQESIVFCFQLCYICKISKVSSIFFSILEVVKTFIFFFFPCKLNPKNSSDGLHYFESDLYYLGPLLIRLCSWEEHSFVLLLLYSLFRRFFHFERGSHPQNIFEVCLSFSLLLQKPVWCFLAFNTMFCLYFLLLFLSFFSSFSFAFLLSLVS